MAGFVLINRKERYFVVIIVKDVIYDYVKHS